MRIDLNPRQLLCFLRVAEAGSVKRTKVAQAFPAVGAKLQFLFDYGDDWRFQVEVIGLGEKTPKPRYPKLLKAVSKAPPNTRTKRGMTAGRKGRGATLTLELLHALRPSMAVITRMRKDTHPPSHEDKRGRPARKGARQPLLSARIADPATRWLRVAQSSRTSWRSNGWIEYTSGTALWHHGGKPIVPILWVLVRYPDGRRDPEAFLCTDISASPRDVLDCFSRRWAVETTFEDARAHLGMETQRQ